MQEASEDELQAYKRLIHVEWHNPSLQRQLRSRGTLAAGRKKVSQQTLAGKVVRGYLNLFMQGWPNLTEKT